MSEVKGQLRVVFDCNVFLQAAANAEGPAAACLGFARSGQIRLVLSRPILTEFQQVALRPKVAKKLRLSPEIVGAFIEEIMTFADLLEDVPGVFLHPADEKDSMYVDLALAAGASVITSRDFHLLNLADPSRPEGADFRRRFPGIDVLTPTDLLVPVRTS